MMLFIKVLFFFGLGLVIQFFFRLALHTISLLYPQKEMVLRTINLLARAKTQKPKGDAQHIPNMKRSIDIGP